MIGAYGERNACFVDEILFVDKKRICTGLDINTDGTWYTHSKPSYTMFLLHICLSFKICKNSLLICG